MYPRLIHIYGPLWIQSYGAMIALGFLVFLLCTYTHPIRKRLISGELYLNTLFLGLAAGIVGGRLLFVMMYWREFVGRWVEIFYPWVGGFVLLGSVIAVVATVPWYLRKHNVPVLPVFDLAAMYAPLLQAIARMGCFFAGCCYGAHAPSWLPWAVTFTDPIGFAPLGIALHPSQVYASAVSFLIFLLLRYLIFPFKKHSGQILFSYLMFTSAARFANDFFRGDRDLTFLAFSDVQLISCALFTISLCGLFFVSRKNK